MPQSLTRARQAKARKVKARVAMRPTAFDQTKPDRQAPSPTKNRPAGPPIGRPISPTREAGRPTPRSDGLVITARVNHPNPFRTRP